MFRRKSKNPIDSVNKTINIEVINGKITNLSKEDKNIIYDSLCFSKKAKLVDLDNAIILQNMKHIKDKKDCYSEVSYCCKICLDSPIEIACIPCGHMFCKKCYENNKKYCHLCRQDIKETLNVFS